MNKWILLSLVIIVGVAAAALLILPPKAGAPVVKEPSNFAECVAAGYPVMESYPRQCTAPSGRNFTEDIGNALEKQDLIVAAYPRPGATITSPMTVTGEARGNWYFEASFPIELLDAEGNRIAQGYAMTEGEWMTTDFVPFKSIPITFPAQPAGSSGTLILHKDNPSGLPENDDALLIPIKF